MKQAVQDAARERARFHICRVRDDLQRLELLRRPALNRVVGSARLGSVVIKAADVTAAGVGLPGLRLAAQARELSQTLSGQAGCPVHVTGDANAMRVLLSGNADIGLIGTLNVLASINAGASIRAVDPRGAVARLRASLCALCPSGEMVDAADSKSVVREDVLVRVRPVAPALARTALRLDKRREREGKGACSTSARMT